MLLDKNAGHQKMKSLQYLKHLFEIFASGHNGSKIFNPVKNFIHLLTVSLAVTFWNSVVKLGLIAILDMRVIAILCSFATPKNV